MHFDEGELRQYAHVSDGIGMQVHANLRPTCGTTVGLTFERWPDMRDIWRFVGVEAGGV